MQFEKPVSWRKGQTIFNFFEWLRLVKKMPANQSIRMADPFHLSDEEFEKLYTEYIVDIGTEVGVK